MRSLDALALLTNEEMRRADALAIAAGTPGSRLMEAAGLAVARVATERWRRQPVTVLCGPGNNGGDGYVAARHLQVAGWPVRLGALSPPASGTDAAWAASGWTGAVEPLAPALLDGAGLVIDALFGAGLARPLEGAARAIVDEINRRALDCLAVDVPSGVEGDTGQVLGTAPRCRATVTFFRFKPGHLLLPGRALAGERVLADIGTPASVLGEIRPAQWRNDPALWRHALRWPRLEDHKYARGHLLVVGGGAMTGAARLAARGARRAGAGMVTVAAPEAALPIYATDQPGLIVVPLAAPSDLAALVERRRMAGLLLGPGAGVGAEMRDLVVAALATARPCLLDADALTSFSGQANALAAAIRAPVVVTPHEGEFMRLFPDLTPDKGKLARAREAARRLNAVVLFKGADTVVAEPGGRAVINDNAPAELASAGTGDVLGGIVAALLGQGVPAFEAAAAAAWIHGAAGIRIGTGLIAEDIPEALPAILKELKAAD
ncbi:MAG: NAD(P)H-hydrate dehydratase [Pseudomonadota bacterium]